LAALLRAAVYFRPGAGTFSAYARRAVTRGLWRYCARGARRRGFPVSLDDVAEHPALIAPSVEDEVLAADAIRRALILREHADLAVARHANDTACRLRAAADTAERLARHRIHRPRRV
jgi:hypothetical protein